MSYYCELCEKEHSEKYNPHKKFKRPEWGREYEYDKYGNKIPLTDAAESLVHGALIPKFTDLLDVDKILTKFDTTITLEKLAYEIQEIKKTLQAWGTYMDRHVPNWRKSGDWTMWAWSKKLGKKEKVKKDD